MELGDAGSAMAGLYKVMPGGRGFNVCIPHLISSHSLTRTSSYLSVK